MSMVIQSCIHKLALKAKRSAETRRLQAEIGSIVNKLYGLTDGEIAVVEKAVKK